MQERARLCFKVVVAGKRQGRRRESRPTACERCGMKYWVTVSVPVEAGNPQDALDMGWEHLIDPDGPPEGLVECVTAGEHVSPASIPDNLIEKAA